MNGLCTICDETIIAFGGYRCKSGSKVNVVTCSLSQSRGYTTSISTQVITYAHVPIANQQIFKYYPKPDSWLTILESTPFKLCSAASIKVKGCYYICGGFCLKQDTENNLYYYEPMDTFWILDLKSEKWSSGPSMPIQDDLGGYACGSVYIVKGHLIYSGGVRLQKNGPHESNQIYKYVSNTKVLCLNLETLTWEIIQDVCLNPVIYAVVPARVHLKELRVHAGDFI